MPILSGGDPTAVIYVRERGIRKWLYECLRSESLPICSKRRGRKPSGQLTLPLLKGYGLASLGPEQDKNCSFDLNVDSCSKCCGELMRET